MDSVVRGHARAHRWPTAEDRDLEVHVISGGITNSLCKVTNTTTHESCLVRLFGAGSDILIDRARDGVIFERMSDLGYGPKLFGCFEGGRVEEYFEHSRALEPKEMSQQSPLDLAAMLARATAIHHGITDVEPSPLPWTPVLWSTLRRWAGLAGVGEEDVGWLEHLLPSPANAHGAQLSFGAPGSVTQRAASLCYRVVYCHNDLLSGNILLISGGGDTPSSSSSVRLIDYEYAAPNYLGYDLANCFCEHCGFLPFNIDVDFPTVEAQTHFFSAYLETLGVPVAPEEKEEFMAAMREQVQLFSLASHLWWGYWATIQAKNSTLDFPFEEYGKARLSVFQREKVRWTEGVKG